MLNQRRSSNKPSLMDRAHKLAALQTWEWVESPGPLGALSPRRGGQVPPHSWLETWSRLKNCHFLWLMLSVITKLVLHNSKMSRKSIGGFWRKVPKCWWPIFQENPSGILEKNPKTLMTNILTALLPFFYSDLLMVWKVKSQKYHMP